MSEIKTAPPPPKLTLLDTGTQKGLVTDLPTEILFQFQPLTFTENISSNWGSSTGLNREHPIIQFSHGEQEQYAFDMKMFAKDSETSIESQLEFMKQAVRRDEDLKRPPLWQFTWGSFIDETVVIGTIGNIRYDAVRSDGTLRGCLLSISLLVYRTIDVELAEVEARQTDTFFTYTKSGEQWEDMALREYDDPLLGELLRRRNPSILFPGQDPGKVVKLPKLINLRNETVEPDSSPLRRTTEGLALRAEVYESRSVSRESAIVLKG